MLYCNSYGAGLREQPPSKLSPQAVQRNITIKNVYSGNPCTPSRSHFALTLPPHQSILSSNHSMSSQIESMT